VRLYGVVYRGPRKDVRLYGAVYGGPRKDVRLYGGIYRSPEKAMRLFGTVIPASPLRSLAGYRWREILHNCKIK